jgi:pimeloyl-ACP methyl ester carboxylesterase
LTGFIIRRLIQTFFILFIVTFISFSLIQIMPTKQWGDDVYAFSRALGLKKFIYMGISRWGEVGYQLVLDHPEVVKAFIPIVRVPISTQQHIDPGVIKALEAGDAKKHLESSERDMFYPTFDKQRLLRQERWHQQYLKHTGPYNYTYEKDLILRLGDSRIERKQWMSLSYLLMNSTGKTNIISKYINSIYDYEYHLFFSSL